MGYYWNVKRAQPLIKGHSQRDILLSVYTEQLPISQKLIFIMQHNILAVTKAAKMLDDKTIVYNAKIKTTENNLKNININTSPQSDQSFQLPHGHKKCIQFIRSIKTLRSLLRSDFKRNRF